MTGVWGADSCVLNLAASASVTIQTLTLEPIKARKACSTISARSISACHLVLAVLALIPNLALAPVQYRIASAVVMAEIFPARFQFGFAECTGVALVTLTPVGICALIQHYTFSSISTLSGCTQYLLLASVSSVTALARARVKGM